MKYNIFSWKQNICNNDKNFDLFQEILFIPFTLKNETPGTVVNLLNGCPVIEITSFPVSLSG